MTANLTVARGLARTWRHVPVRGGGRLLGPLVLDRQPPPETTTAWDGAKLAVSFQNPPEVSIWLWGTYEPDVIAALDRLVTPGAVTIDVGANCGVISTRMRTLAGPTGRVVAIDPSEVATARVAEQAALNGWTNVETVNVGLGDAEGTATFLQAAIGIGALPEADAEFGQAVEVAVQLRRLDDVVAERDLHPTVIKIDTDGGELDILRGAERTLAADRPALVFELCLDGLERRGRSPEDLESLLHDAGYELWAAVPKPRPSWLVGPPTIAGFRPVGSFAEAGPDVPNFVAVDPLVHRRWPRLPG